MLGELGTLLTRLEIDDSKIATSLNKTSNEFSKLASKINDFGNIAGTVIKGVTIAFTAVEAATIGVSVALVKMSQRAGTIEGVSRGFEKNFGDVTKSLNTLRSAAQGTISDFDLMSSANKAALLGVTSDVKKLAGLMVTARLRARELGTTATDAFNDIVIGIGRKSPLILDNLGIKIPDAIKKAMESMSEAEQMQTLLNYAIQDGIDLSKQYSSTSLTAADKAAILAAQWTNLKDAFSNALSPIGELITMGLSPIVEWLTKGAEALGNFIDNLGIDFEERIQAAKGFMEDWWGMNKEKFQPGIEKITQKLGGSGGLAEAIRGLFYPTDEAKDKLSKLLTDAILKILDSIGKDGGLIDKIEGLAESMKNTQWDKMAKNFKTIADAAQILLDTLSLLVEAYAGWKYLLGGLDTEIGDTGVTKGDIINEKLSGHQNKGTSAGVKSSWATGGIIDDNTAIVGEDGPELLIGQKGRRILNTRETSNVLSTQGNKTTNINNVFNVSTDVDMAVITRQLNWMYRRM